MMIGTRRALLGARQFSPLDLPGLQLWLDANRPGSVSTGGAGQFVAANSESLSIADNASLRGADVDRLIATWLRLDTKPATIMSAMVKRGAASNNDYALIWNNATDRLEWTVWKDDSTIIGSVGASTFGAPTTGADLFVCAYQDRVNGTLGISVNGGPYNTAATIDVPQGTASLFSLGSQNGTTRFWNGRISNGVVVSSPPAGIAALAATIRDTLYNGGQGVDLRTIDAATKTAWGAVSAWPCNEISGTRNDVWGTNHLTDNNTVGAADGPYTYAAQDGDPVRQWSDLSGLGHHLVQSVGTKKPLYKVNIVNGRPAILFDGVDDYLQAVYAVARPIHESLVFRQVAQSAGNKNLDTLFQILGTSGLVRFGAGADIDGAVGVGTTSFHVLSGLLNGAASEIWQDGVSTATGNTGADAQSGSTLGAGSSGGAALNCYISEEVLVTRILSAAERSRLEHYMAAKIALEVA